MTKNQLRKRLLAALEARPDGLTKVALNDAVGAAGNATDCLRLGTVLLNLIRIGVVIDDHEGGRAGPVYRPSFAVTAGPGPAPDGPPPPPPPGVPTAPGPGPGPDPAGDDRPRRPLARGPRCADCLDPIEGLPARRGGAALHTACLLRRNRQARTLKEAS
jgi:hypothetical protein